MQKVKLKKRGAPEMDTLLANFSTKSRYAESYRTLRTNIYFSMMEKEFNSLMVTSALPAEGKTTTVANLAFTIAQTGKSVLMVDADLRKPGLTSRFGLQQASGFSTIIADVLGRRVNSGKIADYGIRDLMKLKFLQKRTCIVAVGNDHEEVELSFLHGALVDVYWKSRPEQQNLANILVREKVLTEKEADLALRHQKKSVRRLESILLNLRLVEEKDLKKIISVQMMEAFRVAMEMEDGVFTVRSVPEDEIHLPTFETVNFAQLTEELLPSDMGPSFIRKNVEDNILETEEKNLFILPSGPVPPNPSELIGSPRTNYLIELLKNSYDVVIFDSSPVVPASDALLLSPQVDGVALVVHVGQTPRDIARDTVQQLNKAQANIFGVVLNRADITKGSYYKYYQSYYGS